MQTKFKQMPQLTSEHDTFIVQSLACGMSARDIVSKMVMFFNEDFDKSHENKLLLKVMRVGRSDQFKAYIRKAREAWEKECYDVPLMIRKIRLEMLWEEYHRLPKESFDKVVVTPKGEEIHVYKQNTDYILKILDQARREEVELTRPTREAPKGKAEDKLEIKMTDGSVFNRDPGSNLSDDDSGVPV